MIIFEACITYGLCSLRAWLLVPLIGMSAMLKSATPVLVEVIMMEIPLRRLILTDALSLMKLKLFLISWQISQKHWVLMVRMSWRQSSMHRKLSFKWPSTRHSIHQRSVFLNDISWITFCMEFIFSSSCLSTLGVTMYSSTSNCKAFLSVSLYSLKSKARSYDLFWGNRPTTNHCTRRFSSITQGIRMRVSSSHLSYPRINSPFLFLISFSFWVARCEPSCVLKNVKKIVFTWSFV